LETVCVGLTLSDPLVGSPLAGEPNKLETFLHSHTPPTRKFENSPLAGEPNKLETLLCLLLCLLSFMSSPLAGEPNKLETRGC